MDVSVVAPLEPHQVDQVLDLFRGEWWTNTRTREDVAALLAASTTTVGLIHGSSLVAFARVISDGLVLALVLDVIVDSAYRGQGLGDRLMTAVMAQPVVASANSVELVCQPDMVSFYGRHGFSSEVGGSTLMRRTTDERLQ